MEEFVLLNYNSNEYVLIDSYIYEGKEIFHFASIYDHLLCEKNNNVFCPITDETAERIKEYLGLKSQAVLFEEKFDISMTNNAITNSELNANSVVTTGLSFSDKDVEIEKNKDIPEINNNGLMSYSIMSYPILTSVYKKITGVARQLDLSTQNQMVYELIIKLNSLLSEGYTFNINEVVRRMQDGFIYKNSTLEHAFFNGYYDIQNNVIIIKDNYVENRYLNLSKRVIAHEFIHRSSGREYITNNSKMQGLIEGQTENLVEHFYGNKTSTIINTYKQDGSLISAKEVRVNVSNETAYPLNVALVQQMEFILGETSYKSILEGTGDFENHFATKYGLPLLITMKARSCKHTNKLNKIVETLINQDGESSVSLSKIDYDEITFFQETQNILLYKAFNHDFSKIKTDVDAKKFLTKLRAFEPYRARISRISMGKTVEDNSFEYYYNEMFTKTNDLLEKLGYKHLEIYNAIGELFYQSQPNYPQVPEEQTISNAKKIKLDSMVYSCIKYDKMLDPNNIMTYLIKVPDTNDYCLISTVNALVERAIPIPDVYTTRKFIKELLKNENKFDEFIHTSKYDFQEINFEKSAEEIKADVQKEIDKENQNLKENYDQKKALKNLGMNRTKDEIDNIFNKIKQTLISANQNTVDQQLLNNYYIVCAESYEILKRLNSNLITMIPDNLWIFLETFKQENYKLNYDETKPLAMQNLLEDTKIFLVYVYKQFLCDDNEKIDFENILLDNSNNLKIMKKFGKKDPKLAIKYDENGNMIQSGPYTFFKNLGTKVKHLFHIY